jgi:hypothetical protein
MTDATYASTHFVHFLLLFLFVGTMAFFLLSLKEGYLGSNSEEPKYRMLEDDKQTSGDEKPRRS